MFFEVCKIVLFISRLMVMVTGDLLMVVFVSCELANCAVNKPLLSATANLEVYAATTPFAALIEILSESVPDFALPLPSSVKLFTTPPTSRKTLFPNGAKPAGIFTTPLNLIVSLESFAKLRLIDADVRVNGMGGGALSPPNGVDEASSGFVPTAVSNASENPSPSLSIPEPTTGGGVMIVSVKFCCIDPPKFVAVMVRLYTPAEPAPGVPLSVAVPFP